MKYLFLLLLLALAGMVYTGCKKNKPVDQIDCCDPPVPPATYWELRSVQASITPTKTYASGNGNLLEFDNDRSYRIWANGQVTKTGFFNIVQDTSSGICEARPGPEWIRLVYDSNFTAAKTFVKVADTTLQLQTGCMAVDGGVFSIYKRVQKP